MNIYIAHSTLFDYQSLLYLPLQNSKLWTQHKFILPHTDTIAPLNTKNIITHSDLIIAEVSYPSTGMGIELGWANIANRQIICLYYNLANPSSSLQYVANAIIAYNDVIDLIKKIETILTKF